jgi:GTP pyrophosphokinase/guanosine-3',5'-bis(diphosphate) 3'-pyrophosphohydrolase
VRAVTPATQAPEAAPRRGYLRQFELVERVRGYDPGVDEGPINRAYVFATAKHGSQKRYSGDPYFAHPIEVAGILTEYRLDGATIVAGLLHDTLEDTDATPEEIQLKFGETVADIVEGVTKLSKLEAAADHSAAANLQKFILAMSRDVRVLLVKLADRLHNLRTLRFHPKAESRKRIALETLDIYAPLARRIGMDRMARELEELAFAEAFPEARAAIIARLEQLRIEKGQNVRIVTEKLTEGLSQLSEPARVYGREKQAFSIWRKMQRKSVQFSDLADIYAFRAIVANEDDCYAALGHIHRTWRCLPDAFEDFISNPKANGYRSIHTTVIGPGNTKVEIQIRTDEMDYAAEVGVAAHWRYKNESYGFDAEAAAAQGVDPREAVRGLIEIVEHGGDPNEFIEHAKLEMYADTVFAFTPKGLLIPLPQGATPIDFAYAVHSDIGDRCVGARINGEERPLRTTLANGDTVEVVTSPRPAPVPGWASLAATGRAKSAQRRLERIARREEFVGLGRDYVDAALHRFGHSLQETDLEEAAARLGLSSVEEIFVEVGEGRLRASKVAASAFPGLADRIKREEERAPMEGSRAARYVRGTSLAPDAKVRFAPCCQPIPGDRIVGVPDGDALLVHTIDCERLGEAEDAGDWVDLAWTQEAKEHALASTRIIATVQNGRGVLAQLCQIIAENDGDILTVRTEKRGGDFVDVAFDLAVADARHLTFILAAMRASRAVRGVDRVRG